MIPRSVPAFAAALLAAAVCPAQRIETGDADAGPRYGETETITYRAGVIINAVRGACKRLRATIPVPLDWPEQEVRVVDETLTAHVSRVTDRMIDGTVKQMLIEIPLLPAGEQARAIFSFEVKRRRILPPEDSGSYRIGKRISRDVRKYLGPSPYIESRHREIRDLAREVLATKRDAPDWEKVEALYDAVRERVEYTDGKLKGALQALRDGNGDCEELTSLFIALCRASDIPARTVWVPEHCYPEFYLVDEEGRGHWFPCQAAGTRAFGEMPEAKPILQKGDNIKVPEKRRPQRYVAEFLRGLPVPGGGKPQITWVREIAERE